LSSRLLSRKLVSSMVDRKLNDTEIGAILEAFSESREAKAGLTNQSTTFKLTITVLNFYALVFILLYFLLKYNLLETFDIRLKSEHVYTIFDGRAEIMFWLLICINIGAYYNFGFKVLCLISSIYVLNSVADILIIFFDFMSLFNSPYFTMWVVTQPLLSSALVWMGLSYKN